MALDLGGYEEFARAAVQSFWLSRKSAKEQQLLSGRSDQGERGAVTAGKQMDGFLEMAKAIIRSNGLATFHINEKSVLTLPGYFRPTKQWDLIVTHEGRLVAVLEFKSQVGPSFGNNFNNRTEEVLGSAVDLWTAYREGAFGEITRPFLGYLFLLEDAPGSRIAVNSNSPHFPVFPEFQGASYAERYNLLCRKLVQEGLYTAACLLLSPREAVLSGEYKELSELTGLRTFVTLLAAPVAAEAAN
jgi:hypothetical protein